MAWVAGFCHCLCPTAAKAKGGSTENLEGVMSTSLKDVVKPTFGFQGALQGDGTPNQTSFGGFLPLSVDEDSVFIVDAVTNAYFSDRAGTVACEGLRPSITFLEQDTP